MRRWVALAALFATVACNPQPGGNARGTPTPAPSAIGAPPLRITGKLTHPIVAQRGNRRLYQLAARNYDGISPQGAARTTFYGADITFYDKRGSTLEARAPQAVVEQARHTVTMSGGVVAHSSAGLLLTCTTLVYDSGKETIHGEGNVRASNRQGATITGNRFDSDVALDHIRIR
ncbi:MAG TPA: LPS export ABC transporter periplasmic protein LptC [Candidatus Baltobacteraceae bacterium]